MVPVTVRRNVFFAVVSSRGVLIQSVDPCQTTSNAETRNAQLDGHSLIYIVGLIINSAGQPLAIYFLMHREVAINSKLLSWLVLHTYLNFTGHSSKLCRCSCTYLLSSFDRSLMNFFVAEYSSNCNVFPSYCHRTHLDQSHVSRIELVLHKVSSKNRSILRRLESVPIGSIFQPHQPQLVTTNLDTKKASCITKKLEF